MKTYFLIAQATYDHVEIGLFNKSTLIAQQALEKSSANKLLVQTIDNLLADNNISVSHLSFIAVNKGPAPFTTLRVVLATINGISFASGIKLIGIDGLRAFALEFEDKRWPYTAYLLNAFNNDVYYALQQPHVPLQIGCGNINQLLTSFDSSKEYEWRFCGNGASLHAQTIASHIKKNFFPEPIVNQCSLEFLAQQALIMYENSEFSDHQALPLYLKETAYKKAVQQ
ncbi:MAG: Glycoprotease family protein [Candidatus Dependentiae bacterium ADurb.Bin331]|nr:MAG: Glycoprotease family protein [Candidatus Dependentiae bacterium ADurb.Bin331]